MVFVLKNSKIQIWESNIKKILKIAVSFETVIETWIWDKANNNEVITALVKFLNNNFVKKNTRSTENILITKDKTASWYNKGNPKDWKSTFIKNECPIG